MDGPILAPAKVNLTLRVTGRRTDGYHLLDSLVAFADFGDRLWVQDGDALTVTGPFAEGVPTDATNLIRKALALAGTTRAVTLEKNLPHPAGLGGGSSDAAAILRAIGAALAPAQLLRLGADLPVCMVARASRMRGIGEVVDPVALPALYAVLVNPGLPVPTGQVFRALRIADAQPAPMPHLNGMAPADLIDWIARQANDLEAPATAIAPGIVPVLTALRASGASVARMSGSGATCFGLWPDRGAADDAARDLARPGWWVRSCTLS